MTDFPQWYCLIAEASGQLWRERIGYSAAGVLEHRGAVLMYDDKVTAEAHAARLRKRFPLQVITVIPAPPVPTNVSSGLSEPARLACVQFDVFVETDHSSLGAEMVQVEIRPVMPESDQLAHRVAEILRRQVHRAITTSNHRVIRLGLLDESAADTTTSDTEAA